MTPEFIKEVESRNKRKMWEVECPICKKNYITTATTIRTGRSTKCKSCKSSINSTTHGKSKSRLYSIWLNMKSRCRDKSYPSYHRYGGRGIKVCDEWKNDFTIFEKWSLENGYNNGLQIDRIDNNGNYESNNCRWVTISENASNRELHSYIGKKYGKLLVISEEPFSIDKNNRKKRFFICKCDCGVERTVLLSNILAQKYKVNKECRCHYQK